MSGNKIIIAVLDSAEAYTIIFIFVIAMLLIILASTNRPSLKWMRKFDYVTLWWWWRMHSEEIIPKHYYSPINIRTKQVVQVPNGIFEPLRYSIEYKLTPKNFHLCNEGNALTLYADWIGNQTPFVWGGPLTEKYIFSKMYFRCFDGSEHSIDSKHYSMELQVAYRKASQFKNPIKDELLKEGLLIMSYFVEVQVSHNEQFIPITTAIRKISGVTRSTNVKLSPLYLLVPPFDGDYYSYKGSLTYYPFTEGVQWIVFRKPLRISLEQLCVLRSTKNSDGFPIIKEREVREESHHKVYYYE